MGEGVLVKYLVDCADVTAPVKVDRRIGELDHFVGCEGIDIRYQRGELIEGRSISSGCDVEKYQLTCQGVSRPTRNTFWLS